MAAFLAFPPEVLADGGHEGIGFDEGAQEFEEAAQDSPVLAVGRSRVAIQFGFGQRPVVIVVGISGSHAAWVAGAGADGEDSEMRALLPKDRALPVSSFPMKRLLPTFLALALSAMLPLRAAEAEALQPPVCFAVPGVAMSVPFDNIVLTQTPEALRFEVKCAIGSADARRWTVTPSDRDAGDHALEVTVRDAAGKVAAHGSMVLRVVPRDAGAARTVRLLIVGDSLTAATAYPNEIGRLLGTPGNPKWTMLGTAPARGGLPGVKHEGYGGWRWDTFLTKFAPQAPGVAAGPLARKETSPFVYAGADGKGALDIARYLREECGGQPPDVVTFLLGINDCFGANPDDPAAMDKSINAVLDNADRLLAAFHAAAPKAVLAVGLTTPPNARESGFEANYKGKYHRWGWKRIQHRLVLERLSHREKEGIHLVPTELNLDPVDGYPDNNGVHPNTAGYAQIGASFYAWLKAWLAGKA